MAIQQNLDKLVLDETPLASRAGITPELTNIGVFAGICMQYRWLSSEYDSQASKKKSGWFSLWKCKASLVGISLAGKACFTQFIILRRLEEARKIERGRGR